MIRCKLFAWAATGVAALTLAACASGAGTPGGTADAAYPPMPAVGAPRPFTLPATETYALANGLRVTLIPYGLTPKTVISLRLPVGNIDDGADVWLSDLTVDMMREGAAGRSSAQLAEAAASMGGGLGAGVGMHQTSFTLNVLSEHGPAATALLADVARRPDFPSSAFERVRQNRVRNIAVARSQAQGQADAALAEALYGANHAYGRAYPTIEQMSAYSLDQVRAFHAARFGARGAHIYVAGQFDSAAMRQAIETAFGDWAPGPGAAVLPVVPATGAQVILVDRPGAAQSTIRLAYPAPVIGSPGDLTMRVANTLLGGAFNSRITRNIREAKGYTYSPGSGLDFQDARQASWVFNADVTTDVTGAALTEVFGEIRRLQTEAPTAAENEGARTYMAGIFVLQNATASGVLSAVAGRDSYGLPTDWLNRYVPAVTAVTAEQMRDITARSLRPERMTLVVVGDLSVIRPQLEALPELRGVSFRVVTP